jgi:hypothetical protein
MRAGGGEKGARPRARASRADPALESLPIIVQTSDPSALRAPLWRPLRVSQVMDKMAFVRWFEERVCDLPEDLPEAEREEKEESPTQRA